MSIKDMAREAIENFEEGQNLEKEAENFKNEALEETEKAGMGNLFVQGVKDIVKTEE